MPRNLTYSDLAENSVQRVNAETQDACNEWAKEGPFSGRKDLRGSQSVRLGSEVPPGQDTPTTADEYMEEAAENEESGDRWLSSDLSKALRFYQRAYEFYCRAAVLYTQSMDSSLPIAYYNASRLLLHVYTQYQKTDAVEVAELGSINEILNGPEEPVVRDINDIINAHETAINSVGTDAPTDLLFNAAMVYVDAIDDCEDHDVPYEYTQRAMALLQEVLQRQMSELQENIDRLAMGSQQDSSLSSNQDEDQNLTQPSDILDSVIGIFTVAQTLYETIGDTGHDIGRATSLLKPFVTEADRIGAETLEKFSGASQSSFRKISAEQGNEYLIARAYVTAISSDTLQEVFSVWEEETLPETSEKYLSAADCVESVLHRLGVNESASVNPTLYWTGLCKMNLYFKKASELLTQRLQDAKASRITAQQSSTGELVSLIAKVYIARSDIDLQRSQLPLEQAQNNSEVLRKNAIAFLKNAMNLAKQSGGIREKAVEKLSREKRRIESVCRMCILEGKLDPEELNRIVGAGRWHKELESYRELWYFPV